MHKMHKAKNQKRKKTKELQGLEAVKQAEQEETGGDMQYGDIHMLSKVEQIAVLNRIKVVKNSESEKFTKKLH